MYILTAYSLQQYFRIWVVHHRCPSLPWNLKSQAKYAIVWTYKIAFDVFSKKQHTDAVWQSAFKFVPYKKNEIFADWTSEWVRGKVEGFFLKEDLQKIK